MIQAQIKAVWAYRGFIHASVARDFQLRYKNSLLGATWSVLSPLATITVYTIIFSQIMRARLPGLDDSFSYSIYLCAGILHWNFFNEIITRCQSVFIENANLIKKLNFPRICLPIIAFCNVSINYLITVALFFFFLLISDRMPGLELWAIFPVLLLQIIFALGIGLSIGITNIFFRDVGQFFAIILQFWFWCTPIVYPITILPERFRQLVEWNPMTPIVAAYQKVFVSSEMPAWEILYYPFVVTCVVFGLAIHLYTRHSREIVDEI